MCKIVCKLKVIEIILISSREKNERGVKYNLEIIGSRKLSIITIIFLTILLFVIIIVKKTIRPMIIIPSHSSSPTTIPDTTVSLSPTSALTVPDFLVHGQLFFFTIPVPTTMWSPVFVAFASFFARFSI
jgi:hypothetical protein